MFFAGHNPYPERARLLHLARSGSQSQREIWFILPARGASRIIRTVTILSFLKSTRRLPVRFFVEACFLILVCHSFVHRSGLLRRRFSSFSTTWIYLCTMYCSMNFLSLSCPSHSTDSSLLSSKNFDPLGWGVCTRGRGGMERKRGSVLVAVVVISVCFKG